MLASRSQIAKIDDWCYTSLIHANSRKGDFTALFGPAVWETPACPSGFCTPCWIPSSRYTAYRHCCEMWSFVIPPPTP